MSKFGASATAISVALRPRQATDIDKHIGERVRTRRVSMGISQKELAQHLGIAVQQLQKYESGKNRISAARLYDVAQILQVSVDWFFFRAGRARKRPVPSNVQARDA